MTNGVPHRRWARIFARDARLEIDDELAFHLEQRVRENIARGMDADSARRAAEARLGALESVRDECARLLRAELAAIVDRSRSSDEPTILVAAALFAAAEQDDLLARARALATSTRDRQLVAIATAHVSGERRLVDALARDHLVDHPDNVLVAWIAGASHRTDPRS